MTTKPLTDEERALLLNLFDAGGNNHVSVSEIRGVSALCAMGYANSWRTNIGLSWRITPSGHARAAQERRVANGKTAP